VEPWDYSLRELVWRARARQMEDWDQVAWLCAHVPRFSKRRYTVEDFHPLRKARRQVNISELDRQIKEVESLLPDDLTEDEIEARWKKHLKKIERS
jgi:hypothetical protein